MRQQLLERQCGWQQARHEEGEPRENVRPEPPVAHGALNDAARPHVALPQKRRKREPHGWQRSGRPVDGDMRPNAAKVTCTPNGACGGS